MNDIDIVSLFNKCHSFFWVLRRQWWVRPPLPYWDCILMELERDKWLSKTGVFEKVIWNYSLVSNRLESRVHVGLFWWGVWISVWVWVFKHLKTVKVSFRTNLNQTIQVKKEESIQVKSNLVLKRYSDIIKSYKKYMLLRKMNVRFSY